MEREIIHSRLLKTGYGTHHYYVIYTGDWNETTLINCLDIKLFKPTEEEYKEYSEVTNMNYGGYVNIISERNGITTAKVGIYYD